MPIEREAWEDKDGASRVSVTHMELCSVLLLCASLDERRAWGRMDTCICISESLCCSPATTTTLLIGYSPIQNRKVKVFFFFFFKCLLQIDHGFVSGKGCSKPMGRLGEQGKSSVMNFFFENS